MDLVADDITELLRRSGAGDGAADGRLLEQIYADLKRIARARLNHEHADTLGTTALVHEAWLDMARQQQACFASRKHYFAYAGKAMRHILVDRARQRGAGKRQPPAGEDLHGVATPSAGTATDLVAMEQAMARLGNLSARLARVAELRLFAGFSSNEVGMLLGLTERTVERDWLKARALLGQWLEEP